MGSITHFKAKGKPLWHHSRTNIFDWLLRRSWSWSKSLRWRERSLVSTTLQKRFKCESRDLEQVIFFFFNFQERDVIKKSKLNKWDVSQIVYDTLKAVILPLKHAPILTTKIKFKLPMIWNGFTEKSISSKISIFSCSIAHFMVSTINDNSSWFFPIGKLKHASTNVTY